MRFFARVDLTTTELPDQLQFHAVRGRCWMDFLPFVAVMTIFASFLATISIYLEVFPILIIGFLSIIEYRKDRRTTLIVSATEFIAHGDIGSYFNHLVSLEAADIKELGFWFGSRNGPRGLYARKKWYLRICLLPDLDEQQTAQVVNVIGQKFPQLKQAQEPNFTVLSY